MERFGFYAPQFEIPSLMCARYAVMAAKELSGAEYVRADAWDLGKYNQILKEGKNLDDFSDILEKGKSLILFYNPRSSYNQSDRAGTHVAVYVGSLEKDILLAEQRTRTQRIVTLEEVKKEGLSPVQIISPKK